MAIFETEHAHNLIFAKGCIWGHFPDKNPVRPGCVSCKKTLRTSTCMDCLGS